MSGSEPDHAWADYSEHFRGYVLPQILSSEVFLSIQAEGADFDVKQATEIGAALLLDKPLLLLVPTGRTAPEHLRRAADEIIEDWEPTDRGAQQRIAAAIQRMEKAK